MLSPARTPQSVSTFEEEKTDQSLGVPHKGVRRAAPKPRSGARAEPVCSPISRLRKVSNPRAAKSDAKNPPTPPKKGLVTSAFSKMK